VFNFGPSSGPATQINAGAPADVFASASTKNMDQVVKAAAATSPTNFASNVMEIAVPAKNPAGVTQLSELAKPAVKVALCQVAVPCGATAGPATAHDQRGDALVMWDTVQRGSFTLGADLVAAPRRGAGRPGSQRSRQDDAAEGTVRAGRAQQRVPSL
jgi:hypothetical protein